MKKNRGRKKKKKKNIPRQNMHISEDLSSLKSSEMSK